MSAAQRDLAKNFDHETQLLARSELKSELGSDCCPGALLDRLSAGPHVGKYVHGLAEAAERVGADIHERDAVAGLTRVATGGFGSRPCPALSKPGRSWSPPTPGPTRCHPGSAGG